MANIQRKYPSCPIVGVGGLIVDRDKVLLVKRENEPGKGLWSVPGGVLELGETVREGAKREIREETGIDVEFDRLLDVLDNIIYDEKGVICFHYVLVEFLGHPVGGSLAAATDVREARWFNLYELGSIATTRTLRRLIEKAGLGE
ncbi:MAG: NUDIX hydrolase [Candidatus Bathyarchaeia archaeon]